MGKRFGILLALALLSASAAGYLAYSYLRGSNTVEALTGITTSEQVVLATRDLSPGDVITGQDIQLVPWPGDNMPEGYSVSPAEVVGRGVIVPIRRNEPLLAVKLANAGSGGGLAITIPAGKRAISVKVDDVIAVSGYATPGTRVDVLVTLDNGAQLDEPHTQLVLQNIEILAAGQTTERDYRGDPTSVPVVTLLVDPVESEKLALATTKGRILLALRNPLDLDVAETPGIGANKLLPVLNVPVRSTRRAAPVSRGRTIEVFRGPERSSSEIGRGGS